MQTDKTSEPPSPRPSPAFGTVFTDHMLRIEYLDAKNGWQTPQITKFQNISLHPAAKVLHYATSVFEGFKACKGVDGKIRMFRPQLNLERFKDSAERACLPKYDPQSLLKLIAQLIRKDEKLFPKSDDSSVYIRPLLIGTEGELGVRESKDALLTVTLSPTGLYFGSGSKPIRIYADKAYTRAWPGGVGHFKLSANYGPTLYVSKKAEQFNCQQVLWLFGEEEQLTEVGVMALFLFYINDDGERELITPPLDDGLILRSITRRSILEMSAEWKEYKCSEKRITMSELLDLHKQNRILEMFGAGAAAIVCPVGEIYYKNEVITLPTGSQENPLYARLYKTFTDIVYGRAKHPWAVEVDSLK